MHNAELDREQSSATTSNNPRALPPESAFVEREAMWAKQAVRGTLHELKESSLTALKGGGETIRRHPLLASAVLFGVGFLAVKLIGRAVHHRDDDDVHVETQTPRPRHTIRRFAFRWAKNLLINAVVNRVLFASKQRSESEQDFSI